MQRTAPTYAARQDRNPARSPSLLQAWYGSAARRRVCCLRPGPPVAPARSDTRTSGFRGAPDSASQRRRRSRRTRGPEETMSALRFHLAVISKPVVGPQAIAMAAPFDAAAEEAHDKNDE